MMEKSNVGKSQVSGGNDYSSGDYSSQSSIDHPGNNESSSSSSYAQHQISTTVTANRPSINSYGGNLQSGNPNGNPSNNSSGSNSYKLKQPRNYGSNRYDPMGGPASAGYQGRAAAAAAAASAHLQGQWNNGVSGLPPGQSPYGNLSSPFGLPHHYQQQSVDMYANYYTAPQQGSYGPQGGNQQSNPYGQYGQQMIPPESPKGGHVVYVYGIGQRATQEEIFALFQPYGRVLRVDIIIDFNTGLCKGYAFVAMEQYQEAQLAIQNLNSAPFHGRQLQVRLKA